MLTRWLLLLAALLYSLNQINHGAELMCRQHILTYISENQDQNPQVVRAARTLPFPFQQIVKAARRLPFPFQLDRERVCKARCGFLAVLRYHPERCGRCWWQTPGDGRRAKIIWEYPDGTYYFFFGAVVQSVALVWTFLKLGF